MPKYLTLPQQRVFHRTSVPTLLTSTTFHPAITDWLANGGKAYDAQLYEAYADELRDYERRMDIFYLTHSLNCSEGQCVCASPSVKPNIGDYLEGERSERSLSHVLLQTLGVTSLTPIPDCPRIWLLELLGNVSSFPTSRPPVNPQENRPRDEETSEGVESADGGRGDQE